MSSLPFEGYYFEDDTLWMFKNCLNKIADESNFYDRLSRLFEGDGQIGGEYDWAIHRWSEEIGEDYEVGKFEGFRVYLGPGEHGFDDDEELDAYCDEQTMLDLVQQVIDWRFRVGIDAIYGMRVKPA